MRQYGYPDTEERLATYGQEHLLDGLGFLSEEEKTKYWNELSSIDFSIFERAEKLEKKTYASLSAMPIFSAKRAKAESRELETLGLSAIAAGKVGAVLLCGGQGTRLGFPHAKGMFNIGITKEISIFSLHFRYLSEVAQKAGAYFPVYIMTSIYNHAEIDAFLKAHGYFGYDKDKVMLFPQSMAPATDFDGKIYKSAPNALVLSPDGNGGWFSALESAGLLPEIKANGVEWLNVISIDNVLQKTCDPVFIGATLREKAACGAKVIQKNSPDERIGLICNNNGRPAVIEYYELDKLKKEGSVVLEGLDFGVILNYLFRISDMEKTLTEKLPVHKARKKIPYYNGEYITPDTENGYKYEMLATDLVERMDSCLAFEILREEEFAPVKNRIGFDSVETARELLRAAGYEL